ncbi:MAG: PAS domain-containing protein [Carnobacterium alterfunditum]|jgi:PAS domain S-box-containing protein
MRQKAHQELLQRIKELEHENNLLRQERKEHGCGDKYMREILNNIPAPIYLKDDQGNYLMINKKYEELAHVSLADIVGKNDFEIFPQPVAALFQSQDEEVTHKGIPVEFEETIPLADGIHTFITSKFPLHGENGTISAVGGFCTDITERKRAELVNEALIEKLQKAIDEIKTLKGIIPICASCKQIRDDEGFWNQLEQFIMEHSDAVFSHGICPSCAKKLYPRLGPNKDKEE